MMLAEAASLCLPALRRQLQGLCEAQGTGGLATNHSDRSKGDTRRPFPHGHRAGGRTGWSPVQAHSDIFSPAPGKCILALARSCLCQGAPETRKELEMFDPVSEA